MAAAILIVVVQPLPRASHQIGYLCLKLLHAALENTNAAMALLMRACFVVQNRRGMLVMEQNIGTGDGL
jgi:hypothetical protein